MPFAGAAGAAGADTVGLATTMAFSVFACGLAKTSALLGSDVAGGAGRAGLVGGTSAAAEGFRVGLTNTISVLVSGLLDSVFDFAAVPIVNNGVKMYDLLP